MIKFLTDNKELILILAGIGTFISSLIGIFTLREVIKQRLSLYKPDILIKSFLVAISKSPFQKDNEELIMYKVCNSNDYSVNYNNIVFENSPKYKVENLGFGVAKNIKCEWQFNTQKAIKEIEKIMTSEYSFSYHKDLNLYFLKKQMNEDFHYSAFADFDKQNIDYISPINMQQHYHFHTIPDILIYTHFLFMLFKKNLLENKGENFHLFTFDDFQFPKPILKINYKDLNNKTYTIKYKFKITAVQTQIEDIIDLTKEFCYFEFELE